MDELLCRLHRKITREKCPPAPLLYYTYLYPVVYLFFIQVEIAKAASG